jgi:hypothetical protein
MNTPIPPKIPGSATFSAINAQRLQVSDLNTKKTELSNASGDTVSLEAPSSPFADYSLIFPQDNGLSGQVLSTDGSGVLSWINGSGPSGIITGEFGGTGVDNGIRTLTTTNSTIIGSVATANQLFYTSAVGTISGLPTPANSVLTSDGSSAPTWVSSTGTGAPVRANSPTLINPDIGDAIANSVISTSLALEEPGAGTNTITLQAPNPLPANYTLTLPTDTGISGQVLSTNGSGALSWTDGGSGTESFWRQEGQELVGTGNIGPSYQGSSIALSADGNTMAVGGFEDDSYTGATWIFERSAGVWTQSDKLVGSNIFSQGEQGISVSLSSDGNTLAVGGKGYDSGAGATWIFIRTLGIWSEQQQLLGNGVENFGSSVSLSDDGDTLAIGAPNNGGGIGATYIYTRTAGIWTQQGSELVGTGLVGPQGQGYSVSLSSDGNTLAVGAGYVAGTWIFTRTMGIWTWETPSSLSFVAYSGGGPIGISVSLDSDGNTLAVGIKGDQSGFGATWIFTRTLGVWTSVGKIVAQSGVVGFSLMGSSVSIRGNILAVGGPGNDGDAGAVWIFNRINGFWEQVQILNGSSIVPRGYQGYSVYLNTYNDTLAIGAPGQSGTSVGAAYAFTLNSGNDSNFCNVYYTGLIGSTNNTFENPFDIVPGLVESSGAAIYPTTGGIVYIYRDGLYSITVNTTFSANSTGVRRMRVVLIGGTWLTLSTINMGTANAVSSGETTMTYTMNMYLNSGTNLKMEVYQNSGGVLNLTDLTMLSVVKI